MSLLIHIYWNHHTLRCPAQKRAILFWSRRHFHPQGPNVFLGPWWKGLSTGVAAVWLLFAVNLGYQRRRTLSQRRKTFHFILAIRKTHLVKLQTSGQYSFHHLIVPASLLCRFAAFSRLEWHSFIYSSDDKLFTHVTFAELCSLCIVIPLSAKGEAIFKKIRMCVNIFPRE